MSLLEIVQQVNQNGFTIAIVLLVLSCIKLPRYELNVWELFIQKINKPTVEKLDILEGRIDNIDSKLEKHIIKDEYDEMDHTRSKILNYASLLKRGVELTSEQYDNAADCMDKYKEYCRTHENYPNTKAEASIEYLENCYKQYYKTNG